MSRITTPALSACAVSRLRLLGCLLLVAVIGSVGGAVTGPAIPAWYAGLEKPAWTPPNQVFPIAWTLLYIMMAVALWRLWDKAPASGSRTLSLGLFLGQLALNAVWSPVFFGLRAIEAGLFIIVALVAVLALAVWAAFRVDRLAGWLLVPYLAWVCYATTLNAGIAALN